EWQEGEQLENTEFQRHVRGFADDLLGHRDRRHLAAGDLLPSLHGLAVEKREEGDPGERIYLADQLRVDAQQTALGGNEPELALPRAFHVEWAQLRDCIRQPAPGFVFMNVTWLELNGVDLRMAAQERKVLGPQDRALSELGPEVVCKHPALDLGRLHRCPVQSDRLH